MNKKNKIYLSYIIIGINAIICLIMFLVDNSFDVYTLIRFGAKYNPMIAAGQYFRLFTAMFLHADLTHLLLNMYALSILGKNIELIFGKVKFLIIYLISGIFGSLGSFIFTDGVSVGASGAIFGIFGAYLYLYVRNPNIFYKKQFKNLITIIGINLILGFVFESIDNFAHIWGLIGGFIISWAIGIKGEKNLSRNKIIAHILTAILMLTSLKTGIKLNQDTWQYNLFKGIEHLKKNELNEAEIQFKQGLQKNNNIEDFYFYLGHLYYFKNDKDKARYNFNKAVEINPEFKEAQEMLEKLK